MPVFKVPIHLSYLLYLAGFSRPLARAYFRAGPGTVPSDWNGSRRSCSTRSTSSDVTTPTGSRSSPR